MPVMNACIRSVFMCLHIQTCDMWLPQEAGGLEIATNF